MKRRNFVKAVALSSIGAPLVLKNFSFGAVSKQLFNPSRSAEDRCLVIIQLNGGNDGLNTLIPLDQYDNLALQRQNIILPEASLLSITPTLGFHPVMSKMRDVFNDDQMTIIQNVGYPDQNRSHFRSTDIWSTGMMDPSATTGWLGRHMDQQYPNFPNDYPNATYPDPFAITLGYNVSATCQGLMGNFSLTINDPADTFNLFESPIVNDGTYYGSNIDYLATIIEQTNDYGVRINNAAAAGSTLSTLYDQNNELAMQLQNVAKMIKGGLKTKVYVVTLGGFDTHDSQVDITTGTTVGKHADLLKTLSDAIGAFQDDLNLLNISHRVAGMTFSEFGRQVASNGSNGTDHGDAAPLFLFGSCVNSGVIGANPQIASTITDQAGVPMQIDFRDVYASILKDWFEADPIEIQSLFEHQINFMPILGACNLGLADKETKESITVYPNPCAENATIRLNSQNEHVDVRVINLSGQTVIEVCSKELAQGQHEISINLEDLPSGNYMISVIKASGNASKQIMKLKHL